ncbi:MAG: hypothetical protein K2X77_27405 [Candidatus Obscuribacterales bacterium]|nr:hypothetical protein [Candidatus Obscuribacterales bacterium]
MNQSRKYRVLLSLVLSISGSPFTDGLAQDASHVAPSPSPPTACQSHAAEVAAAEAVVQSHCHRTANMCPSQAALAAPVMNAAPSAQVMCQPPTACMPQAMNASNAAFNAQAMCQPRGAWNPQTMNAAHSELNAQTMCQSHNSWALSQQGAQSSIRSQGWNGPCPQNFAMQRSLDLTSTNATSSASFLGSRSVNINVGGNQLSVTGTSALTAAQHFAAIQVARTGQQSILLNAEGSAIGGSVIIGSRMASQISELVIPQGVSVTTISNTGTLNLSGNLSNSGNLLLGTRNPAVSNFSLSANNINVGIGGSISTIFPSGASTSPGLGLNLTARNNLVNAGTITTSGNLNISAGGSIINAIPQGTTGPQPLMQATGNLNLLSGSGSVVNAGLISSLNGSINVSTQAANHLNVLGSNGTFQARNGNIDFRDSAYTGTALTTLTGGNYFSRSLNFFGGNGEVGVSVGQVSGMLTTAAQIAHVKADTDLLVLGKQCLTGDPTYANTGDIEIAGPITISGGAPLAIIAGGNIISTAADAQIINPGGSVLLIAGANIIGASSGGAGFSGTDPAGGTTADITVSLSGGAGGNIDFAALTPGCLNCVATTKNVVIDTSSSAGAGGDITLVALANGGKGGNVWLSTDDSKGDIYSWSSKTDPNLLASNSLYPGGTVSIFAGADSGTSIRLADVYTSGNGGAGRGTQANSGAGTGALIIHTSQATSSDGNALTINALGKISSPNSIISGALENANIVAGVLNTAGAGGTGLTNFGQDGGNGGYLRIAAGGSVTSDSILSYGGGGAGTSQDTPVNSASGGTGGDIAVAASSLTVRGDINSSGGGGSRGPGGSSGNIDLSITNDIIISLGRIGTGLILASSGGDGTFNNIDFGGGAFGGGGGGPGSGVAGGSGATGGGSGARNRPLAAGGAGGGGGFNGSGGGGGGAALLTRLGPDFGSAGGAGGGGGPLSAGFPGFPDIVAGSFAGGTGKSGSIPFPGGPGQGGGIGGGTGGIPGDSSGVAFVFGVIGPEGGPGGNGVSSDIIGNGAGPANGGIMVVDELVPPAVPVGMHVYERRGGSAGSGNEQFGIGAAGTVYESFFSAGTSTVSGVNAGQITISAKNTFVNGTTNVNNSMFGGSSILALGTGGSVNITGNLVTAGSIRGALSLPASSPAVFAVSMKPETPSMQVRVPEAILKNNGDFNLTNAQLGTRFATDYTPHEPMRLKLPLEGSVSYDQPDLPGQSVFSSAEFTPEVLSTLASAGVQFGEGSSGNFLDLIKGYVFFLPTKEIRVQTREGLVTVPAGAACWIMETGADVAIFDFHDSGSTGPVKVDASNKPFILSPGMQVLLTKDPTKGFNQLNPADGAIGYRHLRHTSLGEGTRAYVCDFSIPHGINNVEVIRHLVRSKDPRHKKSVNQILKNALILADLTGYNYKTSADK